MSPGSVHRGGEPVKDALSRFLVFAFLLSVAGFLFLRSPYFAVRSVTVEGCVATSPDEILDLAGIRRGVNVFAVNVDKTRQILECSPLVKTAEVERELPSTIRIKITERTPVALAAAGGKLWLVDADGTVLGEDNGKVPGLVAITGVSRPLSPGARLENREADALKCLRLMGPLTKRSVSEIRISGDELVLLLKEGGASVFVGSADSALNARLQSLESVLTALESRSISSVEYIELRYGTPSVRFRE